MDIYTGENAPISLDRSSDIRNQAINIIKYTLLLDYEPPPYENDQTLISNVIDCCRSCCSGLFLNNFPIEDYYYNFFGFPRSLFVERIYLKHKENSTVEGKIINANEFQSRFSHFQDIGVIPSLNNPCQNDFSKPFLHNLILQHCIINYYHAVMSDLNCYPSDDTEEALEISEALERYINKTKKINPKSKLTKNNFLSTLQKHKNAIPFFDIDYHAKPMTDTVVRLCRINASRFKKVFYEYKNIEAQIKSQKGEVSDSCEECGKNNDQIKIISYSKRTNLKNLLILSDKLSPENVYGSDKWKIKNPVESLRQNYLFERIFDFRLFYSLLNAILYVNENTSYRLYHPQIISDICACKLLPNTFSRQAILWYAILHIDPRTRSDYNFWNEKNDNLLYNASALKFSFNDFNIFEWSHQFKMFCVYLANFVIPIYEWCFTGMLLESIEKKFGYDSNAEEGEKSHKSHLLKAKELLEVFIKENKDIIMNPIDIGDETKIRKDMIDTVTPYDKSSASGYDVIYDDDIEFEILKDTPKISYCTYNNIPDEIFNQIFQYFTIHDHHVDLGISRRLSRYYFSQLNQGRNYNARQLYKSLCYEYHEEMEQIARQFPQ